MIKNALLGDLDNANCDVNCRHLRVKQILSVAMDKHDDPKYILLLQWFCIDVCFLLNHLLFGLYKTKSCNFQT